MPQLEYRLREYLVAEAASKSREYNSNLQNPLQLPALCDRIRVHKRCVLVASYNWLLPDGSLLQTIRTTKAFHGKPYFETSLL